MIQTSLATSGLVAAASGRPKHAARLDATREAWPSPVTAALRLAADALTRPGSVMARLQLGIGRPRT